jgi:hypothetical protein
VNGNTEAVWLYIKALLPPGLDGALEPGGRENGIIPTNFHGLDFEIFGEPFGLVVEQASGDERNFRDDDFEDWIVDKVLRAWLEETDFYRHLVISAGRVFWFNPNEDPERATLLVDVNPKGCWRSTQARLDSATRLIAYEKVRRWVSSTLNFRAVQSKRYTVTTVDKQDERTEFRIWDKECYLPVKIITVHAFGRIDVRPVIHEEPDTLEFCPGGRPTGLSSKSEDDIKALLNRVEKSLE